MIDYGCFKKDKNLIEMDKMAGSTYILIKDKDIKSLIKLSLVELVEFMKTHPVTKKRITYQEYKSYRKYYLFDFDEKEIFFYLADGYRILMEIEVNTYSKDAAKKCYFDPCVEESICYQCPPTQYVNVFGPDGDILEALFGNLNQTMIPDSSGNSNGYILTDAGMQETEETIRFNLDGFRWECVADR